MPVYLMLFFFCLVGSISYGLHSYLYIRLFPLFEQCFPSLIQTWTPFLEEGGKELIKLIFSMVVMSYFIVGKYIHPRTWKVVGWVSSLWMGFAFLCLIWLGGVHVIQWILSWNDISLPWWIDGGVFIGIIFLWIKGLIHALGPPEIKTLKIHFPHLDHRLNGFKIAQISDIHIGPILGRSFMKEIVRRVNELKVDLVALTGDLVDGEVRYLAEGVDPIFDLKSTYGTFFVTGNHELISGVDPWVDYLKTKGQEGKLTVLENESLEISHQGSVLNVVGVEDWESNKFTPHRMPNLEKALQGIDLNHFTLLLAHQPKAGVEASQKGVHLQLSGHTHGGQIFPFTHLIYLDQPYRSGLYWVDQLALYVNEGTGYWGPPLRLGTRGEITLIQLCRGESEFVREM